MKVEIECHITRDRWKVGEEHRAAVDFTINGVVIARQWVVIPTEDYPYAIDGKRVDAEVYAAACAKIEREAVDLLTERLKPFLRVLG